MGKYFHWFDEETEYDDMRNNDYKEPWVSFTVDVDRVNYNKTHEETLLSTPLR